MSTSHVGAAGLKNTRGSIMPMKIKHDICIHCKRPGKIESRNLCSTCRHKKHVLAKYPLIGRPKRENNDEIEQKECEYVDRLVKSINDIKYKTGEHIPSDILAELKRRGIVQVGSNGIISLSSWWIHSGNCVS